jgi:hypothetical protein
MAATATNDRERGVNSENSEWVTGFCSFFMLTGFLQFFQVTGGLRPWTIPTGGGPYTVSKQ